jgi:act minimal PKS acyl carrier protein
MVNTFTLEDLKRILRAAAGADESVDLDTDITGTSFETLGYDSLGLLEAGSRIEREYRVVLDDDLLVVEHTPGVLVEAVNAALAGSVAT